MEEGDMEDYFSMLESLADEVYEVAERARSMGLDPSPHVEIPRARDLAARVEALIGIDGLAGRIRELSRENAREVVALLVAREVADRFRDEGTAKALEKAVRAGLAVLTEGILVAPLEGIAKVDIKRNEDGTDYVAVYYAGPIRSAGGTGQALSVLIADVVRRELGIGRYVPTEEEVERYKEEIQLYNRISHLQYFPTPDEIETVVKNCPVCIDGEGTEKVEVSGYRNLPRVETNRVRGGMCLVLAEGVIQKAKKIVRVVKKLGIDGWEFVEAFIKGVKAEEDGPNIEPSYKYIKDLVAGRPVFSHPSAPGGFRLRYGRCRTCGLAALAVNPATMYVLDEFLAIGTQMKVERPGKAGGMTTCDTIEGPIVLLRDGTLMEVNDVETARRVRGDIAEIVDVGEILVPYGEFLENNHPLLPGAFSTEWWVHYLRRADPEAGYWRYEEEVPDPFEAFRISEDLGIPLHPHYNLFWHDLTVDEVLHLSSYVEGNAVWDGDALRIKANAHIKRLLVRLGALHREEHGEYVLGRHSYALLRCLGLDLRGGKVVRVRKPRGAEDVMDLVSHLSGVEVKRRAPTRIGGRMGRPEKAKERKMDPAVHGLFPLGSAGGPQRLASKAAEASRRNGFIRVSIGVFRCPSCGAVLIRRVCPSCGTECAFVRVEDAYRLPFHDVWERALGSVCAGEKVPKVKGVIRLMSPEMVPEILEKGILRAKHGVYVYKDGTCRFDITDITLTHFKPREIGLTVERARSLGYTRDYRGNELVSEDQICELKVQDIVIPEKAGDYLVKVANFVDDLLERVYGLPPFYGVRTRNDLIGHLVMGLAPHTSGGVLARIIGFTKAHVCFAHPFFHAAKRRNCDGDEDSVMLLLDGLLNFSRSFLPSTRGGLMDAPLVLTTRIDPAEIDSEAHNVDVMDEYPLEFYEAAERYAHPSEVEEHMDFVKKRLGTPRQYCGFGFTHDTRDINAGPLTTAYSSMEHRTMEDKMNAQLSLARRIRAVDENDVATRILSHHFIPDMMGNLKKFATQEFRCTGCRAKYRRLPLSGKCRRCGRPLILTVPRGGVVKYLQAAKRVAGEFGVDPYVAQRLEVIEVGIKQLFADASEVERKKGMKTLEDFL